MYVPLLIQNGDENGALTFYKDSVPFLTEAGDKSNNITALLAASEILFKSDSSNSVDEATRYCAEVLSLDPDNRHAHELTGKVYDY